VRASVPAGAQGEVGTVSVSALESTDIGKIGIGVIIAIVVIGAILSLVVTAIIGRVIILIVVVALGIFVWQQRTSIENHVKDCNLNMSFVGIHVDAPASVQKDCRRVSR
jgi:hypothetical protein